MGQSIKLKLELKNIGEEPVEYDARQAAVNQSLTVLDANGRPVKYLGRVNSSERAAQMIKPREEQVVVEELNLTEQYDLAHLPQLLM